MSVIVYKCPNCGAEIKFDPELQKGKCDFCLSEFTVEEIERLNNIVSEQQNQIDGLSNVSEGSKSEIEDYKAQIESLQNSLNEMTQRAEIAENLSSEWQNKSFNLQLALTELENQVKEGSSSEEVAGESL